MTSALTSVESAIAIRLAIFFRLCAANLFTYKPHTTGRISLGRRNCTAELPVAAVSLRTVVALISGWVAKVLRSLPDRGLPESGGDAGAWRSDGWLAGLPAPLLPSAHAAAARISAAQIL
jgi:hypothetical protein